MAVLLTTNHGTIKLELDAEKAPKTVENFLSYVRDGHYNGTIFHRVIDGFMIQGGGFEPGMKQKPTKDPIDNEAKNGLKNEAYTIAMARTRADGSSSRTATAAARPGSPELPAAIKRFRRNLANPIRFTGLPENKARNPASSSRSRSAIGGATRSSRALSLISWAVAANLFHGQTARQSSQP